MVWIYVYFVRDTCVLRSLVTCCAVTVICPDLQVYDLTQFQDDHPGGNEVLQEVAGKNSEGFFCLSDW